MEDSIKGMIKAFAVMFIFIGGILNFILLFPVEQGFEFTEIDNNTYLVIQGISDSDLDGVESTLDTGFSKWDIEVGFMGSNTQKASEGSVSSYTGNVMTTLKVLINEVFTTNDGSIHPMVLLLATLTTLLGIIVTYLFIKFIRTGN